MAKRQRDHRAEYLRRKEIAAKSGFGSVRKYKRVRKELSLPRSLPVSIRKIRRDGLEWSASHSRVANSRFKMDFSDADAIAYYKAYVTKPVNDSKTRKLSRLHDYLVGNDLVTEDEWLQNYLLAQSE
jgi:hypothetical protein